MEGLTIVFDLDGTLVDTAPDLINAANHVFGIAGRPPIAGATLKPWISFGARRMIEEGLARSGAALPAAEVDHLLERFLHHYTEHIACESRPFAGAIAALESFSAQGARLAICTNKRFALSTALLRALDLERHFSSIAGRDTFPVSKPHPDHLLGVIRMAGGDDRRAVMIGDSGVDIAAAKAARVPVVAVTFGYTEIPVRALAPDAVIDHYDELEPTIRRLTARPPQL